MTRFWNILHWVCSKPKSKIEKFLTNYVPPAKKQCLNDFKIENRRINEKEGRVQKYFQKWE
jgi:hypothetical protein